MPRDKLGTVDVRCRWPRETLSSLTKLCFNELWHKLIYYVSPTLLINRRVLRLPCPLLVSR